MTVSIESSVSFSDQEEDEDSSQGSGSTDGPRFVSYGRRPSNVKILTMDSRGSWKMLSCKRAGMRSSSPTFCRLKKMQKKLNTSSPDFSTKVIVVVLFVCIISTIIIVRMMHKSHKDQASLQHD